MTYPLLLPSLIAATLYGTVLQQAPQTLVRALIKTAAVASLALLTAIKGGPWLLVIAFLLSSLGDYFLAFKSEKRFLAGLASFLLAHVVLVVMFRQSGLPWVMLAEGWRLVACLALALLCLALIGWLWRSLGTMRLPVLAYAAAIAAMVMSGLLVPGGTTVIIGAFAFAISDSCLAATTFRLREGRLGMVLLPLVVWWLYWIAQVLIMLQFVPL